MGVVIYTKASYMALAQNVLFESLCNHFGMTGEEFAEQLFDLNVVSYQTRYDIEGENEEIEAERTSEEIDGEFVTAFEKDTKTGLFKLFNRIDYQCCEYPVYVDNWSETYSRLQWLKSHLADSICDELDSLQGANVA